MRLICFITLLSLAAGCSAIARSPEDYRKATRTLLETESDSIRSCYDAELAKNATSSGTVIVKFKVESDTGKIVGAKIDEANSTASGTLGQCVVDAISGLALERPDARDGDATFTWEFAASAG